MDTRARARVHTLVIALQNSVELKLLNENVRN